MKKMMMTLAAVLCCAMTTTVFTACGSDSDDNTNTNTPPTEPTIVGYQVDYNLEFPKEEQQEVLGACGNFYLLCDKIEVGYIDENGEEKREVVNNEKWTKTVVYKKSLNGKLKLYLTKPSGQETESLPYDYYCAIFNLGTKTQSIKAIYSDGTKKEPNFESFTYLPHKSSTTISKEKILQYMEEKMKTEVEILTIIFKI